MLSKKDLVDLLMQIKNTLVDHINISNENLAKIEKRLDAHESFLNLFIYHGFIHCPKCGSINTLNNIGITEIDGIECRICSDRQQNIQKESFLN